MRLTLWPPRCSRRLSVSTRAARAARAARTRRRAASSERHGTEWNRIESNLRETKSDNQNNAMLTAAPFGRVSISGCECRRHRQLSHLVGGGQGAPLSARPISAARKVSRGDCYYSAERPSVARLESPPTPRSQLELEENKSRVIDNKSVLPNGIPLLLDSSTPRPEHLGPRRPRRFVCAYHGEHTPRMITM